MIRRILGLFGSLRITVVGLVLLLVLTVWGTLYQVDHGLYGAQERFYQSWFFLAGGFLPFPGAQLVMLVLFINLVAAMGLLALKSRLRGGLIITHLGLLLMLAAGAVTFYLGQESQLTLDEGQGSNVAINFNNWELALQPMAVGSHTISALDARALRPGRTVELPGGRAALRVEEFHRNCQAVRESAEDAPQNRSGYTVLHPLGRDKEPSREMPGVIFTLLEDGREQDRYLVWGGDPAPLLLPAESGERRLMALRRQRLPLPAVIQLLDFRRELHPGSGIAKSYSSQVLVRTGKDLDRKVLISMNKPLRLRGFTFYQSSFASGPGGQESSTFSVVRNYGRLMPYIATGVTVAGMILHFTGMLITRLKRKAVAEGAA